MQLVRTVGERHPLDKKTAFLIFVLASMFMFGYYLWGDKEAFGEVYHYEGDLPIPDNVEITATQCFLDYSDSQTLIWNCKYIFTAEDMAAFVEKLIDPIREPITFPDCEFGYDEVTEECLEQIIIPDIPSNFIPQGVTAEQKQFELTLEKLKVKFNPTQGDLDTIALIESILECERATGSAYGITQEDSFVVPETVIDPGFPVAGHIEGASGKLQLRYQECIGQLQNFDTMFGPDREPGDIVGKEGWVDYLEVPHGERAITTGWETIPNQDTFGTSATAHNMFKEDKKAFEIMCSLENISKDYKKQQGCPQPEYEMGTVTSGTIRINADPIYKLAQYKIDQGKQQLAELLMQQRLDTETQARIVLESHQ